MSCTDLKLLYNLQPVQMHAVLSHATYKWYISQTLNVIFYGFENNNKCDRLGDNFPQACSMREGNF